MFKPISEMTEEDYESFDPGIRAFVRQMHKMGYNTTDSGDGKHKATLGWPEDEWTPIPHVVIRAHDVRIQAEALLNWATFREIDMEIQAFPFWEGANVEWIIFVSGEDLFDWKPKPLESLGFQKERKSPSPA